jgi:hypothetical protein
VDNVIPHYVGKGISPIAKLKIAKPLIPSSPGKLPPMMVANGGLQFNP